MCRAKGSNNVIHTRIQLFGLGKGMALHERIRLFHLHAHKEIIRKHLLKRAHHFLLRLLTGSFREESLHNWYETLSLISPSLLYRNRFRCCSVVLKRDGKHSTRYANDDCKERRECAIS